MDGLDSSWTLNDLAIIWFATHPKGCVCSKFKTIRNSYGAEKNSTQGNIYPDMWAGKHGSLGIATVDFLSALHSHYKLMELHCFALGWLKDDCRSSICMDLTAPEALKQEFMQCTMLERTENPQYLCGKCNTRETHITVKPTLISIKPLSKKSQTGQWWLDTPLL